MKEIFARGYKDYSGIKDAYHCCNLEGGVVTYNEAKHEDGDYKLEFVIKCKDNTEVKIRLAIED